MTVIEQKTFTDFKKDFYSRVNDFSIFDCQDFNLLKVVLDGLKVNYSSRGKIRTPVFYPLILFRLFWVLKNLIKINKLFWSDKHLAPLTPNGCKYLLIDSNKFSIHGENVYRSLFMGYLKEDLKNDYWHIVNENTPSLFNCDDHWSNINESTISKSTKDDIQLIKSLKFTFKKIQNSGVFSPFELFNIQISIQLFFDKYKTWKKYLSSSDFEKCFLICHYHNEALIYALKKMQVQIIEIQHGLIAKEDIFYCFPPVVSSVISKALFADQIWVFGEYWKSVLLKGVEYKLNQIKVLGDYQCYSNWITKEQEVEINLFIQNNPVILISTQTFLHKHFISYVKSLSNKLKNLESNYRVIIKIHPSEEKELYKELNDLTNVKIFDVNLYYLFKISSIHISGYSTTLYEALRFGLSNYSLRIDQCFDYIEAIVNQGVSKLLLLDALPELNNNHNKINSNELNYFYEKYNPKIFLDDN